MKKPDFDKLQQILDYHFNLDSPDQHDLTGKMIDQDAQAKQLSESVGNILKPLDALSDQAPPLDLAQRTMMCIEQQKQAQRIAQASAEISSQSPLPAHTRERSTLSWVLGNLRDYIAVAACLALVFMFSQPALRHARDRSNRATCASNMAMVSQGFHNYANDNAGLLPYVSRNPQALWWKVGESEKDNHSNTRNIYLLVKNNYVPTRVFICPSSTQAQPLKLADDKLKGMCDFPGQKHVNYSFRLILNKAAIDKLSSNAAVMSDKNPLFDGFDAQNKQTLDLTIAPVLLQANSPNHKNSGQNILMGDGHVFFSTTRHVGPELDDIFTIRDTRQYHGNEVPDEDDIFTAP